MLLLDDKKIVVTGVLTDASIAFTVARLAQEQGAEIVLTSFGRAMSLTQRVAKKLPTMPEILEVDVTDEEHLARLRASLTDMWGRVDGVVHSIGFAPEACLGEDFFRAGWGDVSTAVQVSAYSLKALAEACKPLLEAAGGGSIVGLDFDATVAWPLYGWMGVAKAALESCSRYLARAMGPQHVRVNLVCAGPLRTIAAKSIPEFARFEDVWMERAPLGWDVTDPEPAAKAVVALLSDWFPATTGEMLHVDGGFHAVGA